jgi:hypothetical protein
VDEREFFARWDRREERWDRFMTRSDEFMREIGEEVALTREEVRLSREQRERSDAMHADLRDFIREMIAGMERSGRETSRALAAQTAAFQEFVTEVRNEMREQREEMRKQGEATREELRDRREESRAQTNALLRMLDRLGGPEPGGAAGTA